MGLTTVIIIHAKMQPSHSTAEDTPNLMGAEKEEVRTKENKDERGNRRKRKKENNHLTMFVKKKKKW